MVARSGRPKHANEALGDQKQANIPTSFYILLSLLFASLGTNVALYLQLAHDVGEPAQAGLRNDGDPYNGATLRALNRVRMDLHSRSEHRQMAMEAFEEASEFSGERGEGRQGWLMLLKAWDYNNQDELVAENLINNYKSLDGYLPIGYSELLAANWSQAKMRRVLGTEDMGKVSKHLNATLHQWKTRGDLDPGPGCTTLSFATAFGVWNMSKVLKDIDRLNRDIYEASVHAYLQLKKKHPEMGSTELNHALWRLQRSVLDRDTQSYWGGFQDIQGFRDLVATMRHSARRFLGDTHGLQQQDAENKASHPLVVWVSVHTKESVHQPHVTQDALVGGVYYVNVPPGSGRLELYDPRGKSPLDLRDPDARSLPPFHRTIGVQPRPGMLVLFPGWLVHSVLPSQMDSSKDGYRVSISLNLKGEWQTTGALSVGCPTFT